MINAKKETYDVILEGGTLADAAGVRAGDIAVKQGKIAAIGSLKRANARRRVDARGLHILPGIIDSQVHFREPGDNPAEDLESGSRAALLGGVAAVFEMPNTMPPTTTTAALRDKLTRARDRMFCHYAFYVGGVAENARQLGKLERQPGCCGVKVFMGSSTGTLLASEDKEIAAILQNINRRAAFHSEDEETLNARTKMREKGNPASHAVWRNPASALRSTRRLIALAEKYKRQVHVLHISTGSEIAFLAKHKHIASVETTPQHLTLAAPDCYNRLGTFAQMNPPVRGASHRAAIWRGVQQGVVDVIGSDHAPHSKQAKNKAYPASPSGMPGVQTLLPVMLTHVNRGKLTLPHFIKMVTANPARLMGIKGKGWLKKNYDADFTLIDLKSRRRIENKWIASKCGWTPFDGFMATGWPLAVFLGGKEAMREGEILGKAKGKPLKF